DSGTKAGKQALRLFFFLEFFLRLVRLRVGIGGIGVGGGVAGIHGGLRLAPGGIGLALGGGGGGGGIGRLRRFLGFLRGGFGLRGVGLRLGERRRGGKGRGDRGGKQDPGLSHGLSPFSMVVVRTFAPHGEARTLSRPSPPATEQR